MKKFLLIHALLLILLLSACGTTEGEANMGTQNELESEAKDGQYKLIEESYETTMETVNINLSDGISAASKFDEDEYSLFMVIELEIENTGRDTRIVPMYDASLTTNNGHNVNVGEDGFPLNISTEIDGETSVSGDFRVKLPGETLETLSHVDLILPSIEREDGSKVSGESEIRIHFSEEI
ncbi:hypothetical protein [Jeotgalicoccus marinus]|uniref:hypothetical protein n=1 Tax=Jeotgalicoccus marinus TaxID=516700 RepID=UPI0003F4BDD7|nr:hypothetical protein [Jeotgalicoccus marinus]